MDAGLLSRSKITLSFTKSALEHIPTRLQFRCRLPSPAATTECPEVDEELMESAAPASSDAISEDERPTVAVTELATFPLTTGRFMKVFTTSDLDWDVINTVRHKLIGLENTNLVRSAGTLLNTVVYRAGIRGSVIHKAIGVLFRTVLVDAVFRSAIASFVRCHRVTEYINCDELICQWNTSKPKDRIIVDAGIGELLQAHDVKDISLVDFRGGELDLSPDPEDPKSYCTLKMSQSLFTQMRAVDRARASTNGPLRRFVVGKQVSELRNVIALCKILLPLVPPAEHRFVWATESLMLAMTIHSRERA
jgi:hypothetical protein